MTHTSNKAKEAAKDKIKGFADPIVNAVMTIKAIYQDACETGPLGEELLEALNKVVTHGEISELETMLMMQARTLEVLFNRMTRTACRSSMIMHTEMLLNIALRAQNQSRKTIALLADLKSPKRTTFIKQQNNAVNQQVNNAPPATKSKKPENITNELLSEGAYETVDFARTRETVAVNSRVETVGAINGTHLT